MARLVVYGPQVCPALTKCGQRDGSGGMAAESWARDTTVSVPWPACMTGSAWGLAPRPVVAPVGMRRRADKRTVRRSKVTDSCWRCRGGCRTAFGEWAEQFSIASHTHGPGPQYHAAMTAPTLQIAARRRRRELGTQNDPGGPATCDAGGGEGRSPRAGWDVCMCIEFSWLAYKRLRPFCATPSSNRPPFGPHAASMQETGEGGLWAAAPPARRGRCRATADPTRDGPAAHLSNPQAARVCSPLFLKSACGGSQSRSASPRRAR